VAHDDGSFALYSHLLEEAVHVTPGQRVARGALLAQSGNTGFSTGPHLHVAVLVGSRTGPSMDAIPFQVAVAPDRAETPLAGRTYTAWESVGE
jgi:murein DD-endopeptidase MepM/ murein hydrolase activator NlpD